MNQYLLTLIFSFVTTEVDPTLGFPKTTIIEREEYNPAMRNKTGTRNAVSTEDVNTSSTPAPSTDHEVIEGAVLLDDVDGNTQEEQEKPRELD